MDYIKGRETEPLFVDSRTVQVGHHAPVTFVGELSLFIQTSDRLDGPVGPLANTIVPLFCNTAGKSTTGRYWY